MEGFNELCEQMAAASLPLRYAWYKGIEYDTHDESQLNELQSTMSAARDRDIVWFFTESNFK